MWDGQRIGPGDPIPDGFDLKRAKIIYVEGPSIFGARQRQSHRRAARNTNPVSSPRTGHYRTLGLDLTATLDEVKGAYRKLAKQFHPDVNHDEGATERMKAINTAYTNIIAEVI
jgi:hypothetical protein